MKRALTASLVGVLTSVAVLAAPMSASAHYKDWHHGEDKPNIVETAISVNKETGEFSTLIAAASCTNVAERLSRDWREFTLFAPTDAAFAKLNLNAGNVCSSFDEATLTNILEFHINRGSKMADDILWRNKLRMINGDRAKIEGATIAGQNIIQTDIVTGNGIIHVIDGVMLP